VNSRVYRASVRAAGESKRDSSHAAQSIARYRRHNLDVHPMDPAAECEGRSSERRRLSRGRSPVGVSRFLRRLVGPPKFAAPHGLVVELQ
jgi:hypothetical protein